MTGLGLLLLYGMLALAQVVVVAVDMSENYLLSNQLKYSQPGLVVLPNSSILFTNIAKPTALVQCKKCSQHQTDINPKYMCTNSYVGKNKGNFVQTNGQHREIFGSSGSGGS
ncbi:uncharacterized protein LOC115954474 [Quercus lobata]|uniref:uncharacterized protein LOC115954474 n=1 Tax=Quercus lobata TaxID=97700 RepID=UPI0012444964|nr:uncharacterized protein LOC115954474 [Quercus lobata]